MRISSSREPKSASAAVTAAAKLRADALTDFLDEWEAEGEPLTDAEIAEAVGELGLPEPNISK